MNSLRIAILGTRGIPNQYGGFEQAATFISKGLVARGHAVSVYNAHHHPYKQSGYEGVTIIHCYDPEKNLKTAGQFIYDLNCIRNAARKNFDVILFMGYTSSSVWWPFYPKNSAIISNMDGLEWKRSKYSLAVRKFLKWAEKLAVKHSNVLIADSVGIKNYMQGKYGAPSTFIPYGANIPPSYSQSRIQKWNLLPYRYYLAMARMEPENNIEMIIEGYLLSKSSDPLIIIGNANNRYGNYLQKKYESRTVIFTGGLYETGTIDSLRHYSSIYFHGHSVGGTNPSLLEAMAAECYIAAHYNEFNQSVLGEQADYFSSADDIRLIIVNEISDEQRQLRSQLNIKKIQEIYNWEKVIEGYEQVCFSVRK